MKNTSIIPNHVSESSLFDKDTGWRMDIPSCIEPGTRVLCLYRVSTDKQLYHTDNNEADIPMQRKRCRKYCESMGWTIVCELQEEGVSGHKVRAENRDKIQLIKEYAKQKRFDILLVFMFDRIGRISDETPFVVEWFVRNGIRVWSTQEGEQRFDTHTDKLTNYIRFWQADGESEKTSIRTANSMGLLAEDGCFTGGTLPYGYSFVKTGRKNKRRQEVNDLAIYEPEADIVRMIFQLAAKGGFGAQRVANYLNERGIKNRSGKNWHPSSIQGMLRNVLYTGVLRSGKSRSEPLDRLRIVEDRIFQEVQDMLAARSRSTEQIRARPLNTRGQSLLAGNIFCGHCGARLCITTSGKGRRREDGTDEVRTRYTCQTKSRTHGDCDGQTGYTVHKLDAMIDSIIHTIFAKVSSLSREEIIAERFESDCTARKAALESTKRDYEKAEAELRNLKKEIIKSISGESAFSPEVLNSVIQEQEAKCGELKRAIEIVQQELDDNKFSLDRMALLLSLLTIVGTMTTPAFAAEDLTPGNPGTLTERYIDESTSRELAPPTTSKSSWVKDAPSIEGYEFDSFSQTTDHIYSQEEINFIVGYPDKTVRGERSLSRCEAATIFSRLYNGVYPEAKQHLTEKTFSDVPANVWYYDKLSICYNAGILSWCGDGKFQPYKPITRAEFAAMASAFAELPKAESAPFSDVSRSHWAYDDINSAAEAGWIVGYPDGTFRPESEISRAETVTLINRLRNRKITADELRALGVQNPYTDLSESYWAYGELIEATVKHNAADWHKLNYNEDNLNTVTERFVDGEGNELAEPITTKGQAARAPRDFKNRNYLGYTTEITYVYRQGQAVMTGSKEVDKNEAKVGDTLQYTITIGNDKRATGTLRNAIVSDTLSEHLGFVYGSVLVDGENTKYNFDVKTGLLSVNVGDIAPGESKQVSFAAIVKDTAYGEILSNTAVLSADNSEDIPVTDSSTKIEDGKPGLTADKSVDKSEAHVGDTLTYTITARNAEDATAPLKNATLTDTLPAFVDFVQGSVMVDGASGQYGFENNTLTVELGEIAPGAEKAVTFQVTVNNTAYNQSFQNTAILGADNSDPVVPSDEGVTVADGTAKMSATKSVDKAKAKVGDILTYTITASNADTATVPLRNVVMSDTLPKYVTFNQGSLAVDGSPVRTTFNSKTLQLTADLGDIAPGQSKVLTFSALVNNAAYGKKFSNTAVLSADNSEEITATDTGVTVAAGVPEGSSGAKTVSKSKADVGDTLTYSIALRNASTATADWKNVKVTDNIPEHLAFVPGSVEVDGRSSNDYSYNADTHTLTLIADKIAIGKTLTYTFRVTVEDGAQGQYIVNTAKVTNPGREDMQLPDTGVEIGGGQTEPIMAKTASVKKAKPGDTFTYTVEVKNGAKATADWKNVVLSDVLPVGVELVGGTVAIDDTTTEYTLAGQVLEVKLGNLKPNESVRVISTEYSSALTT